MQLWNCWQKHAFFFFQDNSTFTENFLETNCPALGSWKESFKHILRQNWEVASLHKQKQLYFPWKYILYLHIVMRTHYREREKTMSFVMTTALGSGTWRHSKEFSPLVDCDLDLQFTTFIRAMLLELKKCLNILHSHMLWLSYLLPCEHWCPNSI